MKSVVAAGFFVAVVGLVGCHPKKMQIQEDEQSTESGSYDYGKALAGAAVKGSYGKSLGLCYDFVWKALGAVLGPKIEATSVPPTSAYQFGDWADRNPGDLARVFKLKKSSVYPEKAPLGSVIVWNRGQCNYNATHGHIEIAIGSGKACSDFCAPIQTSCSLPRVYVPTSSSSASFSGTEVASAEKGSLCGPKMIDICIKSDGGVAACNKKYACL